MRQKYCQMHAQIIEMIKNLDNSTNNSVIFPVKNLLKATLHQLEFEIDSIDAENLINNSSNNSISYEKAMEKLGL